MDVSVQHHAPAALLPRKKHLVPIEKEAGGKTEPVWTSWKIEKKICCPCR